MVSALHATSPQDVLQSAEKWLFDADQRASLSVHLYGKPHLTTWPGTGKINPGVPVDDRVVDKPVHGVSTTAAEGSMAELPENNNNPTRSPRSGLGDTRPTGKNRRLLDLGALRALAASLPLRD